MTVEPVANQLEYPEDPSTYDYPWVTAWGRYCNLEERHIRRMVEEARESRAPISATYRWTLMDEGWHTLDEVKDPQTRWWLMDYATRFDLILPHQVLMHWLDPEYGREVYPRY